jgi:hypothetical protein
MRNLELKDHGLRRDHVTADPAASEEEIALWLAMEGPR